MDDSLGAIDTPRAGRERLGVKMGVPWMLVEGVVKAVPHLM